jgi:hypothetical protein
MLGPPCRWLTPTASKLARTGTPPFSQCGEVFALNMRYRFRGRWRADCLERERSHNFGFHPNLLSDLGDLQHNACGLRVPRSVSVGRSDV